MPPAWEAITYKQRSATANTNKAKQLFDKINVGEEVKLSVLEFDTDSMKLGQNPKKRIIKKCMIVQKSKFCIFAIWNNRIKCVTEADIITGECQIWRDKDDETIDN